MRQYRMQKRLSVLIGIMLCACTSSYQPLNKGGANGFGYQEILMSKDNEPTRYLLTYKGHSGDIKSVITEYWHKRATQLCVNGYSVIKHKQSIKHGTMKTPVGNIMATVGTQTPYDFGEVECK